MNGYLLTQPSALHFQVALWRFSLSVAGRRPQNM
jgi:hypothetical protein